MPDVTSAAQPVNRRLARFMSEEQKSRRYRCHAFPVFWNQDQSVTEFGSHDTEPGAVRMVESYIRHPEAESAWVVDSVSSKTIHLIDKRGRE